MSLFRAVAWDIDGTLIDSEPLHQRGLSPQARISASISAISTRRPFEASMRSTYGRRSSRAFPRARRSKRGSRRSRAITSPMQESSSPIRARSRRCANLRRAGWRKPACRIRGAHRRRQHRGAGNRRHRSPSRSALRMCRPASPIPNLIAKPLAASAPSPRQSLRSRTAAREPVRRARRGLRGRLRARGRRFRRL